MTRHGDFGPGNILAGSTNARFSGIIDIDFAGLGDLAAELAIVLSPDGFGDVFVRAFRSAYPVDDAMLSRCRFYRGTRAIQEALHGIEEGDRGAFERGIARYHAVQPEGASRLSARKCGGVAVDEDG